MTRVGHPARVVGPRGGIAVAARASYNEILESIFAGATGFHLPLTETSGVIADNARYTAGLGAEVVPNAALNWNAGVLTSWAVTETPPNSDISEPSAGLVRILSDGTIARLISNNGSALLNTGDTYLHTADITTVTSGAIRFFRDGSNVYKTLNTTGVNQERFIAGDALWRILNSGACDVQAAYFGLQKEGELDGGYNGPTLAGDTCLGLPCPTFDNVNDYIQLEHNRLETIIKPENASFDMSLILPIKCSNTVWPDANIDVFYNIGVDANNRFWIYKSGADNLTASVNVGAVVTNRTYTVTSADYNKFLHVVFTISKTNNRIRLYIKGGTASETTYPVGTWSASNLAATLCRLGDVAGAAPMGGSLGPATCIVGKELTAAEVTAAYAAFRAQEPNAA